MRRLVARNVFYEYRTAFQTVRAVNGVSCEFQQGKIYAIIGASGSGKLDVPSKGSILLDDEDTAKINCDHYRLKHISMIYQDFNLFYHLTVLENTAYPLYIRKENKKTADEIAKKNLLQVGLDENFFKRFPSMLSGGEQQRVAIARALAAGSEIILADEPTGSLDSENSKKIVGIMRNLAHESNRCVIIVTHDSTISDVADVVLKMQDGKLI